MYKTLLPLLFVSSAALADDAAVRACRTLPDAPARLACYDAMPLAGSAPALASPPAPAASAAREQAFGLTRPAPAAAAPAASGSIRSSAVGELSGWSAGSRIRLANGQVWRVIEGDAVLPRLNNPQVEVSRGVLGAYFLQVLGHTSAARVTRVE
jgi:hypothetical protein